jgi:hypothetical protein
MAKTAEEKLWQEVWDHLWRIIIKEQHGAVVVVTAEDTPDGGLKSKYYTFSGNQFKSLKTFINLFPEMMQEAQEKLRKEIMPTGLLMN